jgi:hypothetical protein
MRFLFLFALVGAYRLETVKTTCFFSPFETCIKNHAATISAHINKQQDYVSHSTAVYKSYIMSIVVHK